MAGRLERSLRHAAFESLSLLAIVVLLVAWWVYTSLGKVNPILLPSPADVFAAGYRLVRDGTIFPHLWVSSQELMIGMAISIIVGVPAGLITYFRVADRILMPMLTALYAAPLVALIPVIGLWSGLVGIGFKITVVVLLTIFPIVLATADGVRNCEASFLRLARSFGATHLQLFKTIILPGAFPFMMTGFRLALVRGFIAVVVAEFFASNEGLGFLLVSYGGNFRTAELLATTVLISGLSMLVLAAAGMLERRMNHWKLPASGGRS